MVYDTSLYDLLGVQPNATQKTIANAIKAKSLEHHPDRGGSVEMMQKVNAAREILTDPKKRKLYDQYGLEGIKPIVTDQHFPTGSIFDIFNIFNNTSNHRQNKRKVQGEDIKHVLKVSLEDLYLGTTKTVNIDRDIICNNCKGTGSNDGIEHQCTKCKGNGIETLIYRMGPIIQQIQKECSLCNGQGYINDINNQCKICYGNKLIRQNKQFDVNITHGTQNGETIKFIGEANQIPNGESGTVYIIVKEEIHPIFNRNKDDLIMKMEINLTESLCGFQRFIKLLDNHQILINHPPGIPIQPNTYRSIKGYGMPNRHTHSYGNLIIHFFVQFPPNNFLKNDQQRKQLENILPPKSLIQLDNQQNYEQIQMNEFHFIEQKFQNDYHNQTEDDQQSMEDQYQGVHCQTH